MYEAHLYGLQSQIRKREILKAETQKPFIEFTQYFEHKIYSCGMVTIYTHSVSPLETQFCLFFAYKRAFLFSAITEASARWMASAQSAGSTCGN
jgi:hypothetical protein